MNERQRLIIRSSSPGCDVAIVDPISTVRDRDQCLRPILGALEAPAPEVHHELKRCIFIKKGNFIVKRSKELIQSNSNWSSDRVEYVNCSMVSLELFEMIRHERQDLHNIEYLTAQRQKCYLALWKTKTRLCLSATMPFEKKGTRWNMWPNIDTPFRSVCCVPSDRQKYWKYRHCYIANKPHMCECDVAFIATKHVATDEYICLIC